MNQINITAHKPVPLIWWFKNKENIDFDPPYQRRGRLWSNRDKAYLIDTIINGFDVPKLYLADFQFGKSDLNLARLPYAIIDGKQRLEAIFDFFLNKLTLNDDFVYRKDRSINLSGLSLRDIRAKHPNVADDFEIYPLTVMSVSADLEEDIHEIFVRLNKSKPLTGAEVRNAIPGPVSDIIRKLAEHEFFEETIRFSTSRSGDLNAAAKALYFEVNGRPMPTKKSDLDKFAKEQFDRSIIELSGRHVIDTLNWMNEVFIPRDILLGSAGQFPVYYWLIRNMNTDYLRTAREFLVWFENARKKNRDRQKGRSGLLDLDQRLSRYDTLNRSTNDLQSHVGRIDILKAYYIEWLNSGERWYHGWNRPPNVRPEAVFRTT